MNWASYHALAAWFGFRLRRRAAVFLLERHHNVREDFGHDAGWPRGRSGSASSCRWPSQVTTWPTPACRGRTAARRYPSARSPSLPASMTRNPRGGGSSSTPCRGSMASTPQATRSARCARTSTCSAGGGGGRRARGKSSQEVGDREKLRGHDDSCLRQEWQREDRHSVNAGFSLQEAEVSMIVVSAIPVIALGLLVLVAGTGGSYR